jgi:predicted secreted hydrolase
MHPQRRAWLLRLVAASGLAGWTLPRGARGEGIQRGRVLQFPRDHGAHPGSRTEWWYVTGWLGTGNAPVLGFQLTFFRTATGLAGDSASRFAARQLLFAHAAVTSLPAQQHRHDQRMVRWSGDASAALGKAALDRGEVQIGNWALRDGDSGVGATRGWTAHVAGADFTLDLQLLRRQPLLLQGEAGYSRKGPDAGQASHYYSEPQLAASGRVTLDGRVLTAPAGQAWMDHEWSDELLHPEAVGWDWIGINGLDGSALTAFVLRRADGSTLWAGGSWRPAGGSVQVFSPEAVRFTPGRRWTSPSSGASYPVVWQIESPAGRHSVRALMDAQELDGRNSTGSVYWEGLSELCDAQGRRVGLGYLEMTGYAGRLQLG